MSLTLQTALQFGGLLGSQLGQLLLAIVAVGVVILVGRVVLKVAWRLVTIAAVVVGLVLLASLFLG
ncbi:hypothetical protein [Haloplanus halobius]|uniref:hypothetical protein n=1 Tax=Haloplanus halobius TaxID=2934938 RepID=UPI00200C6BEA|nr:hypothetical protein [Haloplanus sp. XH21]